MDVEPTLDDPDPDAAFTGPEFTLRVTFLRVFPLSKVDPFGPVSADTPLAREGAALVRVRIVFKSRRDLVAD